MTSRNLCVIGFYRHVRLVVLFASKYHNAIHQCIECMVLAHSYVITWVVLSAALTYNNVASFYSLTTINFYTESCGLRLTNRLRATATIFIWLQRI